MSKRRAAAARMKKPAGKCRLTGCIEPVSVKKHGLCVAHVARLYRTGDVGSAEIRSRRSLRPFGG